MLNSKREDALKKQVNYVLELKKKKKKKKKNVEKKEQIGKVGLEFLEKMKSFVPTKTNKKQKSHKRIFKNSN